jgi:DNA-binding response OmpR family regulator
MRNALVIDDELDICLMVTKHLQKMHFQTSYAMSVEDARKKVSSPECDLVFIDLTLPDGSGFDVMQLVTKKMSNTKIIVISAHENESAKALGMGASLFITKPFTTKNITEALETLHFIQP